jgi:hypothetical protein
MKGRTMNPAISQLEAFITRLDRQRAHIELSLMDQTRPAQDQEQLEQTYDWNEGSTLGYLFFGGN